MSAIVHILNRPKNSKSGALRSLSDQHPKVQLPLKPESKLRSRSAGQNEKAREACIYCRLELHSLEEHESHRVSEWHAEARESRELANSQLFLLTAADLYRLVDTGWGPLIHSSVERIAYAALVSQGLPQTWSAALLEPLRHAVLTVHPNTCVRQDSMDINKYIHFILVHDAPQAARFVQGVALFSENSALQLPVLPRILFTKESQSAPETKPIPSTIFQKFLTQVKANLIVTTNDVIEESAKHCTIGGVSEPLNNLLARATKGKPMTATAKVARTNQFVGSCNSVQHLQAGCNSYIVFQDLADSTLAGTMFLYGSHELATLENISRRLLIIFRDQFLLVGLLETLKISPGELPTSSCEFVTSAFSVYMKKMCGPVQTINICMYSDEDVPLGKFISNLVNKAPCSKKHSARDHARYYTNNVGRVKLTIGNGIEIDPGQVLASRTCSVCEETVLIALGDCLWELSAHSFLNLWLSDYSESLVCAGCHKTGLRQFRITFFTRGGRVYLEYEPVTEYSIVFHRNVADTTHIYQSMCQRFLEELKHCALTLLQTLHETTFKILQNLVSALDTHPNYSSLSTAGRNVQAQVSDTFANVESRELRPSDTHYTLEVYKRSVLSSIANCWRSLNKVQNGCIQALVQTQLEVQTREFGLDMQRLTSPAWQQLNSGHSFLMPGVLVAPFPVYEYDSVSAIAYALNSAQHRDEVVAPTLDCSTKSVLLRSKNTVFRYEFSCSDNIGCPADLAIPTTQWVVKAHFAQQLHCIRSLRCGTEQDFLFSLSAFIPGTAATYASKGAFRWTHDNKYLIKAVGQKEYNAFLKLGPSYFKYMCRVNYEGLCSLLVNILGVFKVKISKGGFFDRKSYIFVFENLSHVLPMTEHVYDLKGTLNKRRKVAPEACKTKMDLNFVEDFDGLPITLDSSSRDFFETSVRNDAKFLASQNIIDYSLLIVLSGTKCVLGIIDYSEEFDFKKVVERRWKEWRLKELPTIIDPQSYSNRFIEHLCSKYFI